MSALRKLSPFLAPYKWYFIGAALLAIPLAGINAANVYLMQQVTDGFLVAKDVQKLIFVAKFYVLIYTANLFIRFAHYYLIRIVVARVSQKLKSDLFEHLASLSADYFTNQTTGKLVTRTIQDPHLIEGGIGAFGMLLREPLKFIWLVTLAVMISPKLSFIMLVIGVCLGVLFQLSGKHLKRYIGKISTENSNLSSWVQESFTGIRIVQVFRLEKFVRKKFRDINERVTQVHLKTARLEEFSHPLVEWLTSIAISLALYFGAQEIIHDQLTAGQFISFIGAFALAMQPLRSFNEINIRLNQASGACDRIFEIFGWKPSLTISQSPKQFPKDFSEIHLDNVWFSYPDDPNRFVLKGVNFKVKKGQRVALVGASGSGKTSLAGLLPRLFDVKRGAVRVDGVDIRDFALEDLRKVVSVVSQDVFLFDDTIEENIRCGRFSASKGEIIDAARRAYALEFIEASPHGFDTMIGERGQKLSGGQRQRLSIARAFLRESPILILDEATSSLDTASERAVQQALEELMANRTALVIAHRLSTIQNADLIVVMKEGQVVEAGKHAELLDRGEEYARLHQLTQS